jgi:Na+/phosphate symporter
MVIYLSLLICVIGLLMYALAANAKLVEIGRMMVFAGLLAFLLVSVGPMTEHLLR